MNTNALAQYASVSPSIVQRLMGMSSWQIIADPEYVQLLRDIDLSLLEYTLGEARDVYQEGLDAVTAELSERYGTSNSAMSCYTLANWVVGSLQYPDHLETILDKHNGVPSKAIAYGLPALLDMLEQLHDGREEWQRALTLLSIPLMKH